MKIKYSGRRIISTADLFNAADPPIYFEVVTRPPREWVALSEPFADGGSQDVEKARQLVSLAFLSCWQEEGEVYPLDSVEAVAALEAAIEEGNPGQGAPFVCDLAASFRTNYYSYLSKNLGNSERRSQPSNGSGRKKTPAKAS